MAAMPVDGWLPVAVVPVIALAAAWTRATTIPGAVTGLVVGAALAAGAGWPGLAMLAALLAIGTLVSERGGRRRDVVQVFCNGGVATAGALAAGLGETWGMAAAAGALATALSDTMAGEVGMRARAPARLLLFGRSVERGVDGGMSAVGTAAALAGAFLVPAAAMGAAGAWIGDAVWRWTLAGFVGQWIDSVLGAWVQPKLGPRGNDWVNLLASAAGAAVAVALEHA